MPRELPCEVCGKLIDLDELDDVDQNFYVDDRIRCLACAKSAFENLQQSRTMNNPPQDEGDGP
jgi:hypothetical protein